VRDWLDRIDIYLQPSRQEGLPRALIEAMARACPALGSTAGGIPELLAPSCLHDVGDASHLAEQIRLAAAPGWQREQARRNHAHAAQYLPSVLQARREHFWQHARQLVEARR
jgi:glycosyltransferase involved in cell wall biosynthesis